MFFEFIFRISHMVLRLKASSKAKKLRLILQTDLVDASEFSVEYFNSEEYTPQSSWQLLIKRKTANLPFSQNVPFPWYPGRQEQLNEPPMLLQLALLWQLWRSSEHSSTEERKSTSEGWTLCSTKLKLFLSVPMHGFYLSNLIRTPNTRSR